MTKEMKNVKNVTDERRLNYKKTKSERDAQDRSNRKEEKKQGKEQDRLLAFLEQIIKAHGYNHNTFAEKLNTTPQALYWIFSVKDDCDLKKVEQLLGALGYKVTLEFKEDTKAKAKARQTISKTAFQSNDISIRIEGDVIADVAKRNNYPVPEYIKNYPAEGRLHALVELFREGGHNLREFSDLTGIPAYSLRLIFTKDNIRVSQIATIAKAFAMEIVWKLNRI